LWREAIPNTKVLEIKPELFENLHKSYKVKIMTTTEKRKKPRINSHNILSYICFDENDKEVKQGMGRTLNVSEGGILMDTHVPFDKRHTVSLTIGMEDDMMDIKGKIAFCRKRKDGNFETGIQFLDLDEEKLRSLKQFIIIFREEKALFNREVNPHALY